MSQDANIKLPEPKNVQWLLVAAVLFFSLIVSGIAAYIIMNKNMPFSPLIVAPSFAPLPSPLPTPTPSIEIRTKDWKVYSNPMAPYTFKYPVSWIVMNDSGDLVSVGSGSDNTLVVGAGTGTPNTAIDNNIAFLINSFEKNNKSYKEIKDIDLKGVRIYQDLSTFDSTVQAYLVTGNEIVSVFYTYYKYPNTSDEEKTRFFMEDILPTFAYNRNNADADASEWKTYTNNTYGFELKYPQGLPNIKEMYLGNDFSMSFGDGEMFKMGIYNSNMEWSIMANKIQGSEEDVLVGGIGGVKFKSGDLKNAPIKRQNNAIKNYISVTAVKYNDKIYVFNGEGAIFDGIISTFKFTKEIISDKVTYGNLTAYIKQKEDIYYVILVEDGKEIIIESDSDPLRYYSPQFSFDGQYLLYLMSWHEGGAGYVYDIKNKKIALESFSDVMFTPDKKYIYACAEAGMGSDSEGKIYSISRLEIVYDVSDTKLINIGKESETYWAGSSCKYDLENNSIIFDVAGGKIGYSLKDEKEYLIENENN